MPDGSVALLAELSTRLEGIPRSAIHELRTPLTSIRGYAQLLLLGARTPEQTRRAMEIIFRESDRLARMLDQLAKVAETAYGPADLDLSRFDLAQLAEVAVLQARSRWPAHTMLYKKASSSLEVIADKRRIGELLAILLDNAVLYSPAGSTVESSAAACDRLACVAVQDQGIGIPQDDLETIFLCFTRGSNVSRAGPASCRGLGVGLFLACAIATQAGGRLWAESVPGQGSTFHLALPRAV
jgi:two-component system OmpR family sensor kinase